MRGSRLSGSALFVFLFLLKNWDIKKKPKITLSRHSIINSYSTPKPVIYDQKIAKETSKLLFLPTVGEKTMLNALLFKIL